MNTKLLKAFEKLLKDGYYAEAEEQLQQIIKLSPEDCQAKMLWGTCRLFQGDMETAEQIHKEAEEHYATVTAVTPEERTFWQKYHKWIIYGTGAMLLLAGTTCYMGNKIRNLFELLAMKYGGACYSETIKAQPAAAKYGGVKYSNLEEIKEKGMEW